LAYGTYFQREGALNQRGSNNSLDTGISYRPHHDGFTIDLCGFEHRRCNGKCRI